MKIKKFSKKPDDSKKRISTNPVICYPNENLENENLNILHKARKYLKKESEVLIPPRDAKTFKVKVGNFFRIESTDKTGKSWFTIGVSPNIIEASFKALIDSLDYKLYKEKAPANLNEK